MDTRFSALIDTRGRGSPAQTLLWQRVVEAGVALEADRETIAEVLRQAPEPAGAQAFWTLSARHPTKDVGASWRALTLAVDESDETLAAWLRALAKFFEMTERDGQAPTLPGALGYLDCCAAAVGTGDRYTTFPATVEAMLDTYGYTGEEGD